MEKKKRIVIALGGNALGNTLPEQMKAVKITLHALSWISSRKAAKSSLHTATALRWAW